MKKKLPKESVFQPVRTAYTFDPELTKDFDASAIFNRLLPEYENASTTFENFCKDWNSKSISTLESVYKVYFNDILKKAREEFDRIKKERPDLSEGDIIHILDGAFTSVVDKYLINILPLISVVISKHLGINLYDVQIIAGIKLYKKHVLEIKTGEGKTFIIPIAAILYGIRAKLLNEFYPIWLDRVSGEKRIPEHHERFQVKIVTANDYLARRDYSMLHEVYKFFGLTCSFIQENLGSSNREKYYSFDILYCTCSHLCHLTLYDMQKKIGQVSHLPSIHYVSILDEIDQILLDEALTPHIISNMHNPKTYEIDLVYQARKFATKLIYENKLWNTQGAEIFGSEPGLYYFRKILNEFVESVQEHHSDYDPEGFGELSLLVMQYRDNLISLEEIAEQFGQHGIVQGFFLHFFEETKDFFNDYIPFLLQLIRFRFEYVIVSGENNWLEIEALQDRFAVYPMETLSAGFVDRVTRASIRSGDSSYIITLLNFISNIPQYHYFRDKDLAERLINESVNYLWVVLGDYKFASDPMTPKQYRREASSVFMELFNTTFFHLPKIDTYLKEHQFVEAKNLFFFKVGSALRFTNYESGQLNLHPNLRDMLLDNTKLNSYIAYKLDEIETKNINSRELMNNLLNIFLLTFSSTLGYLLYRSKVEVEKTDAPEKEALVLIYDNYIEALLEINDLKTLIESDLKQLLQDFLSEIEEYYESNGLEPAEDVQLLVEELSTEIHLLIEYQEQHTMGDFMEILSEFQQELRGIAGLEEFKRNYIKTLVLIFRALGTSLIRDEIGKPQYEVLTLLTSSAFELLSINISEKLFEEFAYPENEREKVLRYLDANDFLSRIANDFLLDRIINPFKSLEHLLEEYSISEITQMIFFLISSNDLKDRILPLLHKHNWMAGSPFYTEASSDKDLKRISLSNTAKIACTQYFHDLEYFSLNKEGSANGFFLLVQRSLSVLKFYENEVDYIISPVDKELEPYKIAWDPYRSNYEPNVIQIIDKVTGRTRVNNRWSENIHSAVEAKEDMLVRGEFRSSAQITPQTYFATFKHLTGLSGTTIIATKEFETKYALNVEYVPTNQPINRIELPAKYFVTDAGALEEISMDILKIYYTNGSPTLAILEKINDCTVIKKKIQQIEKKLKDIEKKILAYCADEGISPEELKKYGGFARIWNSCFGTDLTREAFMDWRQYLKSLSEKTIDEKLLGKLLTGIEYTPVEKYNFGDPDFGIIDCTFLNLCFTYVSRQSKIEKNIRILTGKPQDLTQESEIIKNAGKMGSILISTRVAGRGTDIKLEQPDKGLYMFIFNHQESRRHDQQIYGRCGRQGDQGYYRFYNSMESGLMRNIMKLMEQANIRGIEEAAIYFKVFSFNAGPDENQEFISNNVQLLQTQYEQHAHMQRIYEKNIGDIAYQFERNLTISGQGSRSGRITQILSAGKGEMNKFNADMAHDPYSTFIAMFDLLFSQGLDKDRLSKIFTGTLYCCYYPFIKDDNHFKFLRILPEIADFIFDYLHEQYKDSKNKLVPKAEMTESEQAFLRDYFVSEIKQLIDNERKQTDDAPDQLIDSLQKNDPQNMKLANLVKLSFQEVEHSLRNEHLGLYNRFIELYKTNNPFSVFGERQAITLNKFVKESEIIIKNLKRINMIASYRVAMATGLLFQAKNAESMLGVKRFLHNFFLLEGKDAFSESMNDNVFQVVVRAMKLPCNVYDYIDNQ